MYVVILHISINIFFQGLYNKILWHIYFIEKFLNYSYILFCINFVREFLDSNLLGLEPDLTPVRSRMMLNKLSIGSIRGHWLEVKPFRLNPLLLARSRNTSLKLVQ